MDTSRWTRVVSAAAVIAVTAVIPGALRGSAEPRRDLSGASLSSLPLPAQAAISSELGLDDHEYWLHRASGVLRGKSVDQHLAFAFNRAGATVTGGGGWASFGQAEVGRRAQLQSAGPASPRFQKSHVRYRLAGLDAWYANGPLGLEQGFTVRSRPGGAGDWFGLGQRVLGNLRPITVGNGLLFEDQRGRGILRYGQLSVTDARGRVLPSRLEARGGSIRIDIRDRGARYPLRVDPVIQSAELTATDGGAGDQLGFSVAMSGSTIVVGTPFHTVGANSKQGAVYVFSEPAGGWSNAVQTAELTASDGAANDELGGSVAISGSTIVSGAPLHKVGSNTDQGAVYVFSEPAGGWKNATQTAELTASDGAANDGLGWSVAIDGSTIIAGAPYKGDGSAYIFTEPAGGWTNGVGTFALTSNVSGDDFGYAVAVSGPTVVIGDPNATVGSNTHQGLVETATLRSGTWQNGSNSLGLLYASDGAANDLFGSSVAIDNATAIAVGAPDHTLGPNAKQGAVYVYARSSGGFPWFGTADSPETESAELTASDGGPGDLLGYSVAVSGLTVVAGAYQHAVSGRAGQGAVYVFTPPPPGNAPTISANAGGWNGGPAFPELPRITTTQTNEVTAANGAATDALGWSVAALGSSVGVTIAAGAPGVGANALGAAYQFSDALPPVSPHVPTISGTATEGQTLTASESGWLYTPTSYSYQWERCDSSGANCSAISGATGPTYTPGPADVYQPIRLEEWATNAAGTTGPARSFPTGVVTMPNTGPPPPPPCPNGAPPQQTAPGNYTCQGASPPAPAAPPSPAAAVPTQITGASPSRLAVSPLGKFTIPGLVISCGRGPCQVRTSVTTSRRSATRAHGSTIQIGSSFLTLQGSQKGGVAVTLTAIGRRMLAQRHLLRATIFITETGADAMRVTRTLTVTLQAARRRHQR